MLPDGKGVHYFRPGNMPLVALFHTLGVKSLRIGGNSVDAPAIPVPSEADVASLFEFAQAAGVKVIYSVRLQNGDLAAAAQVGQTNPLPLRRHDREASPSATSPATTRTTTSTARSGRDSRRHRRCVSGSPILRAGPKPFAGVCDKKNGGQTSAALPAALSRSRSTATRSAVPSKNRESKR